MAEALGIEDGGHIFLGNIGWLSTDYTQSYPKRSRSSILNVFSLIKAKIQRKHLL
jgi:hypothetical protein